MFSFDVLMKRRNFGLLCLGTFLSRRWSPAASEEFQQIVPETDQIPLGSNLSNPAQQKLSELPHVLDLSKNRLDNGLALPIKKSSLDRLKLSSHTLLDGRPLRNPSPRTRNHLARVFHPTGRNVTVDPFGA